MYAGYGGGTSGSGPMMTQQPMPHQPLQHHHPNTTTTSTDATQLQGHQQQARRQKHTLSIVDPNTGQNVLIGEAATDATTDQLSATATLISTTDVHRVSHL